MRAATVTIDFDALRHNLARVRFLAPGRGVWASIKANAYGHGAIAIARVLSSEGVNGFAVACLEEALALREAGIAEPILLLEGPFGPGELALCVHHSFAVAVHCEEQLAWLARSHGLTSPLKVWLKVDSGMHRLGFAPAEAAIAWRRLRDLAVVHRDITLMTHFACADERSNPMTLQQQRRFDQAVAALPGPRSLANSAAVLNWPTTHGDVVRPGLMLYGISPFPDTSGVDEHLRPVMTLTTRLIAVRRVAAGETVGYGATWRAPTATWIGTAAIGYGDGYDRHLPSGTPVVVNGRLARLAGRVSMDMIGIDLGTCAETGAEARARVGDPVVLWGEG
ncbi:MAG: alanine racemase [Candidatus Competibacterales bacterium]